MTRAMKVVLAVLALAIGLNLVLASLWIDRSISLAYMEASARSSDQAMRSLERLLEQEWKGLPEAMLLEKLQRAAKQAQGGAGILIKKEGDIVSFDEACFRLNQGRLVRVGECS